MKPLPEDPSRAAPATHSGCLSGSPTTVTPTWVPRTGRLPLPEKIDSLIKMSKRSETLAGDLPSGSPERPPSNVSQVRRRSLPGPR